MRALAIALLGLAACGDDGARGTASDGSSVTQQTGILTMSGGPGGTEMTGAGTDAGTATEATPTTGASGGSESGVDPSNGPKFDLPPTPDAGMMMPDTGCTKVDLLFVIDDSGSMLDEQQTLVQSFPEFVAAMQAQLADAESYHVGVVTSDAYPFNEAQCVLDGALVTQTAGEGASNKSCLPFTSGKRWMDETEDLASKFACAGQVGTSGDGDERPMYTMLRAVNPELGAPGACNDGFIREDALLVVVVITDEEDDHELMACGLPAQPGSAGEPMDWYNGLVFAKGGVETNVVVLSLVGPVNPQCPALDKCNGGINGAETASRIVQFAEMFTYGSIGQICAQSYKQFFADAISVIDSACENFMPPG
ncbi:hypothetical protein [Nannocystis sp.]|uniref:hypothetical protein n=1 Tax=Nannocystis sp. TaxID=1962667 RepID=UPI0024279A52|nr:hypothetical protein [Nannocystis sp.]MBK7829145.1 hypothetical protein [Nannocystis sp.]MBK9751918.1 hypothetical protein [Nannocystis sp.]